MRQSIVETPVSPKPLTVRTATDAPLRIVCGALCLALALLIVRLVGQL